MFTQRLRVIDAGIWSSGLTLLSRQQLWAHIEDGSRRIMLFRLTQGKFINQVSAICAFSVSNDERGEAVPVF